MTPEPDLPIGPDGLPIGSDGISIERRQNEQRREEDKLKAELERLQRRARLLRVTAFSVLLIAVIASIVVSIVNTAAISRGDTRVVKLTTRLFADERAQRGNRAINVSIWCSAINSLEESSIKENHIKFNFHPLPCKQLEDDSQSPKPSSAAAKTAQKYVQQYGQLAQTTPKTGGRR
jgi:hypothetical protein